jgi:hypothetical protein
VRVAFELAVGAVIFGHVMPGGARIAAIGRNISVRRVAVVTPVTVQPIVMAVPSCVDGVHIASTGKPLTASTDCAVIASRLPRRPESRSYRRASKMAGHTGFP